MQLGARDLFEQALIESALPKLPEAALLHDEASSSSRKDPLSKASKAFCGKWPSATGDASPSRKRAGPQCSTSGWPSGNEFQSSENSSAGIRSPDSSSQVGPPDARRHEILERGRFSGTSHSANNP